MLCSSCPHSLSSPCPRGLGSRMAGTFRPLSRHVLAEARGCLQRAEVADEPVPGQLRRCGQRSWLLEQKGGTGTTASLFLHRSCAWASRLRPSMRVSTPPTMRSLGAVTARSRGRQGLAGRRGNDGREVGARLRGRPQRGCRAGAGAEVADGSLAAGRLGPQPAGDTGEPLARRHRDPVLPVAPEPQQPTQRGDVNVQMVS